MIWNNAKNKNKNKRLIEEEIVFAISAVSGAITIDSDSRENKIRAETVKTLAEAYAIINGTKGVHDEW